MHHYTTMPPFMQMTPPSYSSHSKSDLITGTTFVKDTFAQFALEVHLGCNNTPDSKSKTEAILYFPAHSKPILEETEEELISGRFIISENKFVEFTKKATLMSWILLWKIATYMLNTVHNLQRIHLRRHLRRQRHLW